MLLKEKLEFGKKKVAYLMWYATIFTNQTTKDHSWKNITPQLYSNVWS